MRHRRDLVWYLFLALGLVFLMVVAAALLLATFYWVEWFSGRR